MTEEILKDISESIVNFDLHKIGDLTKEALNKGIPSYEIVTEGMSKGMEIVGQKFEAKEYFLAELVMAAEAMKKGMAELEPSLKVEGLRSTGRIVIGTVKGDVHDIGKNIVITLLIAAGFEVHDLGVDVTKERFVEKVKEVNPDIVGMSALLATTVSAMKEIVEDLKTAGLRERVKVIIGGSPTSDKVAQEFEADAAAKDAAHGVRICKEWMSQAIKDK